MPTYQEGQTATALRDIESFGTVWSELKAQLEQQFEELANARKMIKELEKTVEELEIERDEAVETLEEKNAFWDTTANDLSRLVYEVLGNEDVAGESTVAFALHRRIEELKYR